MTSKQVIASIATAGSLIAGGVSNNAQLQAQDALINPYTDTGTKLEMRVNNDKVQIDKNGPKVTLQKWNGADSLDVNYSKTKKNGKTQRQQMTKIANYDVDAKESVVMEPSEDGQSFNIDIKLNSKPDSNVFTYQFDNWQNKDFFYQPALNVEMSSSTCTETDCGGAHRPENVVGSYAVYSKVHKNHVTGQTNYETGKLFHIYRPLVTDADGSTTWASLNIQNGLMSVTVPQEFLDKAVYPVVVDPTFGYTTIGGTTDFFYSSSDGTYFLPATRNTLTENANVSSMTAYITKNAASFSVIYSIYTNGLSRQSYTNSVSVPLSFAWTSSNINVGSTVSSGNYYTGVNVSIDGSTSNGQNVQIKYDSGGTSNFPNIGSSINPPPATVSSNAATSIYSIYATYTASGGGTTKTPSLLLFQ